jgi:hypothetical protein
MFTSDPEMDFSVICYDPDFAAPSETTMSGVTVTGTTNTDIVYDGSTDTGVVVVINVNATMTSGFTLSNTRPDLATQQMIVTAALAADDVVTISTVTGNKYIKLERLGVVSSLAYALDPTSSWISLQEGTNHFRVQSSVGSVPYSLAYTTKYGGL